MSNDGAGVGEERVGVRVAFDRRRDGRRPTVIVFGQAIDLIDAEDGIGLEERDIALDLIAIAVHLGLCEPAGVDHDASRLALADVAAQFGRLFEGHPDRRGEAARDRLGPQQDDVHAAIGLAVVAERPSDPAGGVGDGPGPRPWTNAVLEIGDDAIGDARVDVRAGLFLFSLMIMTSVLEAAPIAAPSRGPPRPGKSAHPKGRNAVEDGEAVARASGPAQDHGPGGAARWASAGLRCSIGFQIAAPPRATCKKGRPARTGPQWPGVEEGGAKPRADG